MHKMFEGEPDVRRTLMILWMALIFGLSAIPDLKILYPKYWLSKQHHLFVSHIDWNLVLSLNNPFFDIPALHDLAQIDTFLHKSAHVVFFSVLGVLAYRYACRPGKAWLICVLYALFDELHQSFTPGRYSRLFDVLLDSLVALLLILVTHRIRLWKNAKNKKPVLPV
jgi:VanZ family protein